MKKFLREMRRREVFRTSGLYIGIAWIVIEVSSVVLPTFDAPDWILRWLVIIAMVGFPVVIVLAWVFDVTEAGIVVQDTATEDVSRPIGGRKMDFVVIGVLSVALIVSVYLNVSREPGTGIQHEPITVLIADFENSTGNPLFDGSLEQALGIGIEGAAFINAMRRDAALSEVRALELGERLDEQSARLVSVRQNVDTVLTGSIRPDGNRLQLELKAIDPASGEVRANARARARDSSEVLGAVNSLAADIRKDLGDDAASVRALKSSESLTTRSLEAIKDYTTAQDLARTGQDDAAIDYYRQAIERDPEFARAWSGWGLSAFKLGRRDEADEKWQTALSLLDRMTERERYRTLGLYYTVVSLNYDKAIENYQQLVEKFPADGAGNNNLAILYIFTAQYDKALAQSRQLLEIYPQRILYRANHAQYAMYAGDMAVAREFAAGVIEEDPTFFKSYMILAIVALHDGDIPAAKAYYEDMAGSGPRGASLANTGLADIALYEGRYDDAIALLQTGLEQDRDTDDDRGAGTKTIAMAQAHFAAGDIEQAVQLLQSLQGARGDGQLVPAAEIYAAGRQFAAAAEIADLYGSQLRPTAGAYAGLITGMIAYQQGEFNAAIGAYTSAIGYADLWIIRYYLGQAYLAAGYPVEASAEFTACIERRGEAGGLYFDDVPTWRYTADLQEWKERASERIAGLADGE